MLGAAYHLLDSVPARLHTYVESELTFIGLFGMLDPPRAAVKDDVGLTKSADVRTV